MILFTKNLSCILLVFVACSCSTYRKTNSEILFEKKENPNYQVILEKKYGDFVFHVKCNGESICETVFAPSRSYMSMKFSPKYESGNFDDLFTASSHAGAVSSVIWFDNANWIVFQDDLDNDGFPEYHRYVDLRTKPFRPWVHAIDFRGKQDLKCESVESAASSSATPPSPTASSPAPISSEPLP